jgi:exodeoxyribonuclease V alpha subunit
MNLLRELNRIGALRTLDDALANTLRRLTPDTPDAVLAAAALASLAVAQGHAGFDPAQPRLVVDADLPWPEAEAWRQSLAASPFIATPGSKDAQSDAAPLVFEHGLLYLRRYREYERRLALRLRAIAAHPIEGNITSIAPLFAALFPREAFLPMPAGEGVRRADEGALAQTSADDAQARAAALALRRNLLLVTGGPGTGKTTTIARLLALRIAQALQAGHPLPRIALAAPTGRAADRMAESLRRAARQMDALGIDPALLAALPDGASTLHRLLGVIPESPRFRHHADNPLPFDIVVVDEASMVDLPLMCKLAEAVPDGTQLILLGDPDQLPSVEAGDVLAGILRAAGDGEALLDEDAEALQSLLGEASARHSREGGSPASSLLAGERQETLDGTAIRPSEAVRFRGSDEQQEQRQSLQGHRIHLHRGWRQSDTLDLAPLADAVRRGDVDEALALLRGGTLSNVHFHEGADDPLAARGFDLLAHFRRLAAIADPAEALAQANHLRLLTALRDGPQGARGLNARIEAQLSGRRIGSPPAWFPGRLLLITENSYRHGLFNGDVGVCLPDEAGTLLAWFPGANGIRAFHPAALPAHESAFAMTVHKAQGSEFDEVWLQLPRADARVLSRELLYTGLTRARTALHVAASAEGIAAALGRHAGRVSGLRRRLE